MMQVREYAELTTDKKATPSADLAIIEQETFDWLAEFTQKEGYGRFIRYKRPQYLQLQSYVGYLQSPQGEAIEVLPKTRLGTDNPTLARQVLRKMLCSAMNVSPKEAHSADLQRMDLPIHEWIFNQFLQALNDLVASGLRFDYLRVEEESSFIRGQLDIAKQQRQPIGQAHRFHVRHDVYHPDRLENRLIKTALNYVQKLCKASNNWRLANELSHILMPIHNLTNPLIDLPKWVDSKALQSYRAIKPWCKIILEQMNPNFQKGSHQGIALLFPMEKLFEKHITYCLKSKMKPPVSLLSQVRSQYMTYSKHIDLDKQRKRFNLKPDILIKKGQSHVHVMDTKWKLLNSSNDEDFGISQSDIYQLFAYGHKYLNGQGEMMLIYPKHANFNSPLDCLHFSDELRLWAVPFCIEEDRLVVGAWKDKFLALNY